MARPLKPIDGEQVFKLAKVGLTQKDIAEFFECSQQTISERFAVEYHRARRYWKMSLRRAQFIRATRDRSDSMLIHLGKTYLGQGDKLEITNKQKPAYIQRAMNVRDQQTVANTNGSTNGHTEHSGHNGDT